MPPRKRRPRVNRHFRVDHDLPPAERDAYLALLREPRTTIDLAHAWLAKKGYRDFSRSAVARHRRHYLEGLERAQAGLRQAQAFARLAGSTDAPDFTAGAMLQAEHLLFEQVRLLKQESDSRDGPLPPQALQAFAEALSAIIETRARLAKLQRSTALPEKQPPAVAALSAQSAEPRFETIAREVRRLLGALPITLPPRDPSSN